MNDIRAKFEEIWPVPVDVYWSNASGMYLGACGDAMEHNARLDTFTRCQETMAPVFSLVDELVGEIEKFERSKDLWLPEYVDEHHCEEAQALHTMRDGYLSTLDRAKQITGAKE